MLSMDYFSKFIRPGNKPSPKITHENAVDEFTRSWRLVESTLLHPDERQLARGIKSTEVPGQLKAMVDALVWESTRIEEGATGACLEYLLKNDVLGSLVKLSESDRPFGIQAEVLRSVQNMVVLLDEQFLVHSAVHKAVLRLLRNCVGDDLQEQLDGRNKVMGAARTAIRSSPSEYEEDLVNLLCILCSRIRTYRELLMIFFHDKHWYRSEPLFSIEEEGDLDDEDMGIEGQKDEADDSSQRVVSPTPSHETAISASTTKRTEYEFLLFNYLLRFVHREGQIGDFARAGLLFLMDVAMSPGEPIHRLAGDESPLEPPSSSEPVASDPVADAAMALAEYIVDGDFSEVLAAGLAAVYSLLPSKLEIRSPVSSDPTSSGMVLGSSGIETKEEKEKRDEIRLKNEELGLEDSSSPDFKLRLDHFLKLLEFLQDVLRRNVTHADSTVGDAVAHSILDAVRRVFLENVLYPSILECSDNDGSAIAVMSYIEIMIRVLDKGQLGELLVDFLLSEDNDELNRQRSRHRLMVNLGSQPPKVEKKTRLVRRKSSAMVLLEMEAPGQSEYFTSMGRFTLKDLLLSNLRSQNLSTATAALQLLQSLLLRHSQLCVDRLIVVIHDPKATSFPEPFMITPSIVDSVNDDTLQPFSALDYTPPMFVEPDTTYFTHEREVGLYLTLVSRVDPSHAEDAFSTGYDHYLRDALVALETQRSFTRDGDEEILTRMKHRLIPNDPVLSLVLESLRKFFANTPELNMALTGVLATLALDPYRSLAGWLTFATSDKPSDVAGLPRSPMPDYEEDGDDRSIDFRIEEKLASDSMTLPATSMDEKSRPVIHSIFHGLVTQLERYRQLVEKFDHYLLERRQGLLFSENLTDALTLALDFDAPSTLTPRIVPPPAVHEASAQQKLKPKGGSSFVSFLTPKKSKLSKPATTPSQPSTPPRSGRKSVDASPFGPHYQKTRSIKVEPYSAPVPFDGPWTPSKSKKWSADEEDVFSSGWEEKKESNVFESDDENVEGEEVLITLSRLLDNVVILEESMKELVAIIHARRSLGIDSIRYM